MSKMMGKVSTMLDFDKIIECEGQRSRLKRGSCILNDPRFAVIVQEALLFRRGERHLVHAWCVMTNHVHGVVSSSPDLSLIDWLGSVKKFSSRKINEALGESGPLWERESFDHLLRSEKAFDRACQYVENNPVEAGLCSDPSEWRFSSAHPESDRDPLDHFVPPDKIPFVAPTSRGELPHIIKENGTYFVTFRLLDSVILRRR